MRKRNLIFLLAAGAAAAWAQKVDVIQLDNFRYDRYDEKAFTVKKPVEVTVKAVGAGDGWDERMLAKGWILDQRTRQVVWELSGRNSERGAGRYTRVAEEEIELEPGEYEIYYAVTPSWSAGVDYRDFGDFIDDLFSGFSKRKQWRRNSHRWGISLRTEPGQAGLIEESMFREPSGTIVQLRPLGDNEHEQKGFTLRRRTAVRVYAVGEGE